MPGNHDRPLKNTAIVRAHPNSPGRRRRGFCQLSYGFGADGFIGELQAVMSAVGASIVSGSAATLV